MSDVVTRERPEPEAAGSRRLDPRWLVRATLVIGAVALLWLAEDRIEAWQLHYSSEFKSHLGLWLQWIAPAVLSGIAFGLAGWLPEGRISYRWGRVLLLGVLPFRGLFHFTLVVQEMNHLPRFLQNPHFYMAPGPQFALAIMLGVAIAAGLAPTTEGPGATAEGSPGTP